jgi:manganese transport system permease protein
VEFLTDPLQFGFMQNALVVAIVASVVCSLLSCWLVLMGWSLMGEAVAHSILPGVVLASLFGAPLAVGAFIFGMGAVLLIGGISTSTTLKRDTAIGIVFTTLFALGIVLISRAPSETHLQHILFGNVLGTSTADLLQVSGLGALIAIVLLTLRRNFVLLAFDRLHAVSLGMSPGRWSTLLLMLLALTAVTALQTLGVILVVAMLVIPGATAAMLTRTFGPMLWISCSSAVLSAITGVYLSYWWDLSTSGCIVLTQSAQFGLAYLLAPRKGLISTWRRASAHPNRLGPNPAAGQSSSPAAT